MSTAANNVADWYNQNAELEDTRLESGRLEFAVTWHTIQELISKLKPDKSSLNIADIGCGTGVYGEYGEDIIQNED